MIIVRLLSPEPAGWLAPPTLLGSRSRHCHGISIARNSASVANAPIRYAGYLRIATEGDSAMIRPMLDTELTGKLGLIRRTVSLTASARLPGSVVVRTTTAMYGSGPCA